LKILSKTGDLWWKRHLKVYHLIIARSKYGIMVQILGGLITYILLAIYCHNQFREKVSVQKVREMELKIRKKILEGDDTPTLPFGDCYRITPHPIYAKT